MASIAKLVVSLGANTADFETDMKRAAGISERQMKRMERQAKQLNDKWNKNFKMAGLAVAGGLALATKAAIDFEKAMGEVSTLLDDTSGLDDLAKGVKQVSVEFGKSPIDEARALYQIISAGASDAATQMEQLTIANKLAVGGVTSVEVAADGLTTVLNAYAGQGLTSMQVSDSLFTTMKLGKTTVEELATGIGATATIAAQTGVSMEELNASIGTLTKSGIATSEAFSGMKGVLSAVLKQSPQSIAMAKELGVQFNIAGIKSEGFAAWLETITGNSKITEEKLAKLFGRVEGLTAVMSLGANESAEYARQLEEQGKKAGATGDAVAKMMDLTAFKANQARSAIHILGIEFGEKLLSAVSGTATAIVNNIDSITAALEPLIALITVRVGAAVVTSFASMVVSAGGLATAMAFLGGPIGAAALALTGLVLMVHKFSQAAKETDALLAKLTDTIDTVTAAWIKNASAAELVAKQAELRNAWIKADNELLKVENEIADLMETIPKGLEKYHTGLKALTAQQSKLKAAQEKALKGLTDTGTKLSELDVLTKVVVTGTKKLTTAVVANGKAYQKAVAAYKKMQILRTVNLRIKEAGDLFASAAAELDKLVKEQDEYETSLKSLLDVLYPVEAAGREFGESLAIIARHAEEAGWSQDQLNEAVRKMTDSFNEQTGSISNVTKEFDLMQIAMDEGVRILERTFTALWDNLLTGSGNVWDTIKDGFSAMLSSIIHEATTRKITMNIQQGLAGTNPNVPGGGINWQQLGGDLVMFAGIIAGSAIGGGGSGASTGAAIGAIAGQIVGSILGPIGGMVGSVVGGILGGLVGGLFDSKPKIGAGGFDIKPGDTQFFKSLLGGVFVGNTKGGMDEAVGEFGRALADFDNTIASFLSDSDLDAVSAALKNWSTNLKGDAATIENLIESRFKTIMSTFTTDIQAFVRGGDDLVAQVERLQVAVSAADIIESSDLFSGRTVTDFLTVIEAFQNGTETIVDAFNEVLALLNMVVAVTTSLRSFADSDLSGDFQTLLDGANVSLTEAVAGMNSALMDAIAGFNGSPEQLQQIGLIASSVREGELKLLSQIDAIQKGLNANLEKLKNDLLGITAPGKTGQELFAEAQALLGSIASATGPAQIAALGQQFEAIIRSIAPDDQTAMQDQLVALVESFQAASNSALELQRQTVLDNAAAMRELVDVFLVDIGDPLAIIAASNQQAADALESIAGAAGTVDEQTEQAIADRDAMSDVMDDGLDDISSAVSSIGPQVASAVRSAVQGVNVIVNVQIADSDLVNE